MADDEKPWYEDDIPDGASWEDILYDLRDLVRKCVTRSGSVYGLLEWTLLNPDERHGDREHLLKIVREGQERLKPLPIYLDRINEYILRKREMRDKGETDT